MKHPTKKTTAPSPFSNHWNFSTQNFQTLEVSTSKTSNHWKNRRQNFQSLETFHQKLPIIGNLPPENFQSLEKPPAKLPNIGNFHPKNFQTLEKPPPKLPIIGKTYRKTSKHWKLCVHKLPIIGRILQRNLSSPNNSTTQQPATINNQPLSAPSLGVLGVLGEKISLAKGAKLAKESLIPEQLNNSGTEQPDNRQPATPIRLT